MHLSIAMSDTNQQKAEGLLDEAKGRVKQAAGALANDADLKADGHIDEAKGRVKQAAADAKSAVENLTK
ncbi:MAG: CsbD family protein [Bacteroidota bacterium]